MIDCKVGDIVEVYTGSVGRVTYTGPQYVDIFLMLCISLSGEYFTYANLLESHRHTTWKRTDVIRRFEDETLLDLVVTFG